jgi:hypothetical protein
MALEADYEARRGDYRKALTTDLFAARSAQPADPVSAITNGWSGIPDVYPALFAEGPLTAKDYQRASALLAPS